MKLFIKYLLFLLIPLAGIIADQASKNWAVSHLKNKPVLRVIENVLELGYTENHGMVFGINNNPEKSNGQKVLRIIRIIMSIGLFAYIIYHRKRSIFMHLPLLIIFAGAIGNLIDSFKYGYVIDFIHMHAGKLLDWPFFYNLADAYVSVGMVLIVVYSFLPDRLKKQLEPQKT